MPPGPWVNKGLSEYDFDSAFEDSTTVSSTHGVAVDWNNCVWSGSHGSTAAGIIIRDFDGTEAPFSPFTSVTVDGTVIDLSEGRYKGMAIAKDGNIIYVKGSQLIKINYNSVDGIAVWNEPGSNSLTIVVINPIYVINGVTFQIDKTITLPNAAGYSRGVEVSPDATIIWTGDLGHVGSDSGPVYKWTSYDFVNYTITDSIFANSDGDRIFSTQRVTMNYGPNNRLWVSQDDSYRPGDNDANFLFIFNFNTF
jgi:hypothetical protein